jgi:hypothetical protein
MQENQSKLFKEYSQIAAGALQGGGGSGLGLNSKLNDVMMVNVIIRPSSMGVA